MEILISTVLSVPIGILSSFLFWWWLARWLAPRVQWSSGLAVPPESARTDTDHDQARVKVVNSGRRDAIDLQISAHLRIPAGPDGENSLLIVELPTSIQNLPRLRRGSFRYVRLCFDQIAAQERARLMFATDKPALGDDLATTLALTPGAAVRIYLFAYDSFSGARNMFVSPDYTSAHVVTGAFDSGLALAPVPDPGPRGTA